MGKDAAAIRNELQPRLAQIARDLGRKVYPDGLPLGGILVSKLEDIAGALGDEIARQLIQRQRRGAGRRLARGATGGECPVCGGPARKAPDEPRELPDHARPRGLEGTGSATAPAAGGLFS